jgi:hypothetical protein
MQNSAFTPLCKFQPREERLRGRATQRPRPHLAALLDVATLRCGGRHPYDPPCGVVIGCYWHVALVDLQIRAIRYFCGDVPILVSDDCSPDGRSEGMQAICDRHGVDFRSNPERWGHVGGDLEAFRAGLAWAKAKGLAALCKLSQRWICLVPRWLQNGAISLLVSGEALAGQACVHPLPLRSEACLLDVERWARPEHLAALSGRNGAAETIVGRVHQAIGGELHRWAQVGGSQRRERTAGVLWHSNTSERDYRTLAGFFGVDLGAEFNVLPSDRLPNYHLGTNSLP